MKGMYCRTCIYGILKHTMFQKQHNSNNENDGLQMLCLTYFTQSLKITWI